GHDLLEQFQPLSADAVFIQQKTRGIAAGAREACDVAIADRIYRKHEQYWHAVGSLPQRCQRLVSNSQESVRHCRYQFGRLPPKIDSARSPARIELQIAPAAPAQGLQRLPEGFDANPLERIVTGASSERANAPPSLGLLLRPRHHRPRRRSTKPHDELAPLHSITSSARSKRDQRQS